MDCFVGKKKSDQCEKGLRGLTEKVRLFQEEMKAMMHEREKEARAYEIDMMVFAFKEAEWKQERKKLKEELKRLRKAVEEKDERIRVMEDRSVGEKSEKNGEFFGTPSFLVEQMREERVWRDEAVDKWKKLYLAIKAELDDLILRTHRGDGLYRRAEEEMIEELKMEVRPRRDVLRS
ncbi:hypothetical protein NC653_024127 [Populus alba x Populus x berolinensis]|uniref:Uncharacterized protein n=1 Tax=Populus alba x Populus x berolinensis TaxID=444605 RepID=A0AAD6M8Y7_9ROSI|nr:hypothetical protein NC653_024127 [Populus alba x Populus x berolinensis]